MAFLSMGPLSSSPISSIPGARIPQSLVLALDDTVGTSDLVSLVGANAFTFNDPVSVTDNFSRVVTYARLFPDGAGASDALTKDMARQRTLADSAGAVDAITIVVARNLDLNDIVSATDVLVKTRHLGRVFNEFLTASDEIGFARALVFDDEVGTDDDTSLVPLRNFADFVAATDKITVTLTRTSVHMTAEPDVSYIADVAVSHRYRLDAAVSSHLFIDSVEEYSPEETRSPAHATE